MVELVKPSLCLFLWSGCSRLRNVLVVFSNDFPACLLHLWEYQSPAFAEHGQLRSVAFLDGRARKKALSYWKLCVCHRVLRLRSVEPRIRDPSCLPCRPLAALHSGSASTMNGSKSLCNLYFIVHWSFMLPRMYATSMRARGDPERE